MVFPHRARWRATEVSGITSGSPGYRPHPDTQLHHLPGHVGAMPPAQRAPSQASTPPPQLCPLDCLWPWPFSLGTPLPWPAP